ncbi:MAG: aconitase/3-isopropylmalate dehydratase large subunit family protein [Bacillota bacterium]
MAGQTMAEKLLARASGEARLRAGAIVDVPLDWIMIHEGIAWGVAKAVQQIGADTLAHPEKVVALLDHLAPPPDVKAAEMHQMCRQFVERFSITHFHDMRRGICHQVMVEEYARPREIIVGSDSHTTTYGALASFAAGLGFTDVAVALVTGRTWFKVPETIRIDVSGRFGDGISAADAALALLGLLGADGAAYMACEFGGSLDALHMSARFTLCNLAAEMGAKVALMPPDGATVEFLARHNRPATPDAGELAPDPDAVYRRRIGLDLGALVPMVALPPSPDRVRPVAEVEPVRVDQVFIGGCANGRLEDMRAAARLLRGRKVNPHTRLIVVPASYEVMRQMSHEGILDTLIDAGAVIGPPTCGPCFGGHFGLLAADEVCVSTGTRNFVGRMGSDRASIYLASPYTAAASAVAGHLADPRTLF